MEDKIREENKTTLEAIFTCLCGGVLLVGSPELDEHDVVKYYECKCIDCGKMWKVSVDYEEMG